MTAATAIAIVTAAMARFAEIAEGDGDGWGDMDTFRRFAAVARSGCAWVSGPRSVTASLDSTPDCVNWGNLTAEVLDTASTGVFTAEEFKTGKITRISATEAVLTW